MTYLIIAFLDNFPSILHVRWYSGFISMTLTQGPHFFYQKKINWDSIHARLNSHYVALSYKKKKHKKIKVCRESSHLDHGFWKTYGLENVLWCTKVRAPKASSGERCAHRNFVLLVTLGRTCVRLTVHLTAYQMTNEPHLRKWQKT